jgi:hypothetical protein
MKASTDRQDALRFWGLGTFAVLLCAGTVFSYLSCMANGMAASDMIGLRGREGDVITAQRWARFWFTTAVCCLAVSGLAGALATPIYEDASRLSRFIARLVVATTVSFVLAALIGWVTVSIAAASRHSVIR